VTDKDKFSALAHLLKLTDIGEPPTIRETGLSLETIEVLLKQHLVKVGCRDSALFPDELDRYIVFEVTTTGKSWLLRYEADEKSRPESLPEVFASTWRNKLVELIWGLIGLVAGAILGWHLHKWFGAE